MCKSVYLSMLFTFKYILLQQSGEYDLSVVLLESVLWKVCWGQYTECNIEPLYSGGM